MRRWPPPVFSAGINPLSTHRLSDDSLTPIAVATSFGEKKSVISSPPSKLIILDERF
jgi:hypothetical protein